jgi:hypothetical protein
MTGERNYSFPGFEVQGTPKKKAIHSRPLDEDEWPFSQRSLSF